MKRMFLAAVLTLVMVASGMSADACGLPGSWLVASKSEKKPPPVLIIKGEGGKVTGVEKGGKTGEKKKKKK